MVAAMQQPQFCKAMSKLLERGADRFCTTPSHQTALGIVVSGHSSNTGQVLDLIMGKAPFDTRWRHKGYQTSGPCCILPAAVGTHMPQAGCSETAWLTFMLRLWKGTPLSSRSANTPLLVLSTSGREADMQCIQLARCGNRKVLAVDMIMLWQAVECSWHFAVTVFASSELRHWPIVAHAACKQNTLYGC